MKKNIFFLLLFVLTVSGFLWAEKPLYAPEVLVVYRTQFTQSDLDAFAAEYQVKETDRGAIIRYIEARYSLKKARTYLKTGFFV
jgi:hypothetical protein